MRIAKYEKDEFPRLTSCIFRNFSFRISYFLLKYPITPNQITLAGALLGLISIYFFYMGDMLSNIIGSALLFFYMVFDCVDGEIARAKNLSSKQGEFFDIMHDIIIRSMLYVVLGYATYIRFENILLLFLGIFTAMIFLLNSITAEISKSISKKPTPREGSAKLPMVLYYWFIFPFFNSSDFCLILLGLSFFDLAWVFLIVSGLFSLPRFVFALYFHYKVLKE